MTTPSELRALADRVCAEEPSELLREAVCAVIGYDNRKWINLPDPLHNLSDAAAMMPAGWRIRDMLEQSEWGWTVEVWKMGMRRIIVTAPTEPRARTALALRVQAAIMEDGE